MSRVTTDELLKAGVHFGHLKRKWNPEMAPYIFMERNGIHIIDLKKTAAKMEEAAGALKNIAKSGRKILFVATKKQAKALVEEKVKTVGMPYVVERWSGGMLTNFGTVRRSIKKMQNLEKMETDGTLEKLSKRERLQTLRKRTKMQRILGSIADLNRLPAALFVVDVMKERIAVHEAKKLHIPVFGIVDTNSDPSIDFVIPANDDASKSISLIVDVMVKAISEGLQERKAEKVSAPEKEKQQGGKGGKRTARKSRARKEGPRQETVPQQKDSPENTENKDNLNE